MQLRKQKSLLHLVWGLAVAALAVGMFAWGARLQPENRSGRDLYQAQNRQVGSAASALGGNVILTASGTKPSLVADSAALGVSARPDSESSLSSDSPAATFYEIYTLLKRNYVEGVPDDSKLSHGAAAAMIASLQDPRSRFYEPSEFAELQQEAKGQYAGIGAALAVRTKIRPKAADDPTRDKDHPDNTTYELTVVTPLAGSPAEKAGLKTGDVITDIDGHWIATYDLVSAAAKELKAVQDKNDPVALNKLVDTLQKKLDNGLTLSQAENKLTTVAAKPLALSVKRPGIAAPLTISVQPVAAISVDPVSAKLMNGNIGYIKVNEFSADTTSAFNSGLTSLGDNVKGLVLDLRSTVGDSTEAGAAVVSRLSTLNTLGYQVTKGNKIAAIPVTPQKALTGPIEVLINGGTSNVAELVASALHGAGAKLIGSGTFGDSADVKLIALRDGSGFSMTIGQLLTASKQAFGDIGIKPDLAVNETPGADSPLNRAIMEMSGRVARLPVN